MCLIWWVSNWSWYELAKEVLNVTDNGKKKLANQLAGNQKLRKVVKIMLEQDTNFKQAVKGDEGPAGPEGPRGQDGVDGATGPIGPQGTAGKDGAPGPVGPRGPEGPQGIQGIAGKDGAPGPRGRDGKPGKKGDDGPEGEPGKDSDPSEIMNRLAHNSRLKREIRGERGEDGEKGEKGDKGKNATMNVNPLKKKIQHIENEMENAQEMSLTERQDLLQFRSNFDREKSNAIGGMKRVRRSTEELRDLAEKEAEKAEEAQAGAESALDDTLQLKSSFTRESDGVIGRISRTKRHTEELKDETQVLKDLAEKEAEKAEEAQAGAESALDDTLQLKSSFTKESDGIIGRISRTKRHAEELKDETQVLKDQTEDFEKGAENFASYSARFSTARTKTLHRSRQSIEELQKKSQLKIVPGESYDESRKEAAIELEVKGKGVVIATFLEIGYFFKNDELYIHNHITDKNILIPKHFHFLKVVKDGLDNYKLAFCNNLGNLFFDHKKYDPEYADLPEEHKLIDLKHIKNAANIDLSKYYYHTHTPLFALKIGELEGQSLENYKAEVYEIEKNKKIGTLIDEFCFYEHDKLRCVDYHQGHDHHTQDLDVRIEDHKGNFQIGDNTVHPITLYDSRLDLLDYLGYS